MKKILLIALLALFSSLSLAQEEIDPRLSEQLQRLENNTISLRGLDALEDVPLNFPSRDDLSLYLADVFADFYTPEIVVQETGFYVAFGFLPEDYDLLAGVQAVYQDQIAGFYDTETEQMNVIITGGRQVSNFLPLLDQIVFVHEYTHALQDQHFDLDSFLGTAEGDAYLARLALIEGDATAVMSVYTSAVTEANPLMTVLQLGAGILQAGNITLPAGTAAIIEAELTFPYTQGQSFVAALYNQGGWDLVNAAYTDTPPLSTEQILHPERYFAGDAPVVVNFDSERAGWEIVKTGIFGEFYLREWLQQEGLKTAELDLAATGWAGDSYAVYQNASGLGFVLEIAFDNPDEQAEFVNGIRTIVSRHEVIPQANEAICWQSARFYCLSIEEASLHLFSAPSLEAAWELRG